MIDDDKIAIKEMAQIICLDKDHRGDCERCCYYDGRYRLRCSSVSDAEKLYAKGYRKQSEGEWRPYKTPLDARQTGWICSKCSSVIYDLSNGDTDFCPNCGARMKGGE